MSEQQLLDRIIAEHARYMDQANSFSKSELFENALWISSVQMNYEQILNYRLEPEDFRLLARLLNPLGDIARAHMNHYEAGAFSLSIADGIDVANNNREVPIPKLFYAEHDHLMPNDADKAAYMMRLDVEYAAYKKEVLHQSREEMTVNFEAIATRQAVYAAMKEYPYGVLEFQVVSELNHPLQTIGEAVDQSAPDDMKKADLFELNLASVEQKAKMQRKKKNRYKTER